MLEFSKEVETARFYDPSEEEVKEIDVEIREDSLTGKTSRILAQPIPESSEPDKSDVKEKGFCPFCPENIEEVGALDVEQLSKDKMKEGEAVLMPNITPYARYSLVIRLAEEHYLPLEDFEKEHFLNGFKLARKYLENVEGLGEEKSATMIMNYLKPAGSSIVHPHMQLLISESKLDYQERMIRAAKEYYKAEGVSYWKDLVEKEKDGERYVGSTGIFDWITAFAPRGFDHVKGITEENFLDFEEREIKSLSEGIVKVLKGYGKMNHDSFNFSLFIPPTETKKRYATVIDLIRRTSLDKFYRADEFAMPKLMDEAYSDKKPESLTKEMREYF